MERCYGIVIEGLFSPNSTKPVAITSGASDLLLGKINASGAVLSGITLAAEEGLTDRTGTINTSIDPFRVREAHGSFNLRMAATDRLGSMVFRKGYRSAGKLDVAITSPSATTIDFNTTGLDLGAGMIIDPVAGSYNVVWLGTEAILVPLGSETAPLSGIYNSCIRGALATTAGTHNVGTYVWNQMPYWVGRRVWLFDAALNRTPTCRIREVGRLAQGFEMDKGHILIRATSHLTSLDKLTVNNKPFLLTGAPNQLRYELSPDFLTGAGLGGYFTSDSASKGFCIRKSGSVSSNQAVFIQNGDHCQYYDLRDPAYGEYVSRNISALFKSELLTPDFDNSTIPIDPHFLFAIINPTYETWVKDGYRGEQSRPAYAFVGPTPFWGATEDFEGLTYGGGALFKDIYKYHPVAICAAMLLSTPATVPNPNKFDVLHPNWSLNIPEAFSTASINAIHDLIQKNPWEQIQYLVLGKDSQPVVIMEVIRDILQTYGYRLGIDGEGYLTFVKVGMINVEQRSATFANNITAIASDLLSITDGSADTTPHLVGKFGETPFWQGSTVEISTNFDGTYPLIATLNENEFSVNALTIAEIGELRTELEGKALLMDFQTPRLNLRVPADTGIDLGLGQWLNLNDLPLTNAWVFDSNGNRLTSLGSATGVRWVGQIIGRRYLIPENAYELELFFLNDDGPIRWRAPSLRITGAPQTVNTRLGTQAQGESPFGNSDFDSYTFTVGDDVQIYNGDGTLVSATVFNVVAIDDLWIELNTNVAQYNVGDYYLELSNLRTSGATGYLNNAVIANIDRAYAFMGRDPDGRLGTRQDPADIYG